MRKREYAEAVERCIPQTPPVFHQAMSRTLGISRAAVWKAIEALRQEGYEIQSATKRGYRLERAPDRVREGELAGRCRAAMWEAG